MTKIIVRTVAVSALLAALALLMPPTATAQDEILTRIYKIEHVSLDSARTLARSVCEAQWRAPEVTTGTRPAPTCEVASLAQEQMLTVIAAAPIQAEISAMLDEFDQAPQTRSFHIVVLAASRVGNEMANVPPAVEQALRDVAEFLPYTSFKVLGSGWLRSAEAGETTLPGPMEFSANLRFRPSSDPDAPILIEGFGVYRRIGATYTNSGEVARQAEYRSVLETTFTIDPGETVVVGTSKLNGDDEAVVVVLTAVAN